MVGQVVVINNYLVHVGFHSYLLLCRQSQLAHSEAFARAWTPVFLLYVLVNSTRGWLSLMKAIY